MDGSLVRILSESDGVVGTGFIVDNTGSVLTCHHVVDGLGLLHMEGSGGARCTVTADSVALVPQSDLAVVPGEPKLGAPLAVAPTVSVPINRYITKGFHRLGDAIRAAYPAEGRVSGTTTVRYHTSRHEYEIEGALVLRDEEFGPGLSGAPVVDPESGVVFGVVSTMLSSGTGAGGFAVRLTVDTAPPALRALLEDNARTVPAYGRHLNQAGLRTACSMQLHAAMSELALLNRVDLVARVPREDAVQRLTAVLHDVTPPIVALVGPSGVGKSTEMAALAESRQTPTVLLRGTATTAGDSHVGASVAAALHKATEGLVLHDDGRLLSEAVARSGGLLVILDAVDKMAVSPTDFGDWCVRSLEWIDKASARMVLSSRPEFWNIAAQELMSATPRKVDVVGLGVFTESEMLTAADRHGIALGGKPGVLKLPVVLALYAEASGAAGEAGQVSVSDVIDLYVQGAARRIAAGIGSGASPETVLDWLLEAARVIFDNKLDELSRQDFRRIFPDALLAGDRVIAEHVMSSGRAGYRFVYDDVADWLQARFVELDDQISQGGLRQLQSDEGWRRIGPIAYALREVARTAGTPALTRRLEQIMDTAPDAGERSLELVIQTLLKIGDVRPYMSALHRAARVVASQGWSLDPDYLAQFNLSIEDRVALSRVLMPLANYRGWRQKDWPSAVRSPGSLGATLLAWVADDPERGFEALGTWFEDDHELAGGEATVADVALGILFRLRRSDPDAMWKVLGSRSGSRRYTLLESLAKHDALLLADLVVRLGAGVPDRELTAVAIAQLPLRHLPEGARDAVLAVARNLVDADRPGAPVPLLHLLARHGDGEACTSLIDSYRLGASQVSAYWIVGLVSRAPAEVLGVLIEALGGTAERRKDVLGAATRLEDADGQETLDRAVLELLNSGKVPVSYEVHRYVEDRLWAASRLEPPLEALFRVVAATPQCSGWGAWLYPLTDRLGLRDDPAGRMRLVRELMLQHNDLGTLRAIVWKAVDDLDPALGNDLLALEALGRMDAEEADRVLAGQALSKDAFARTLYEWLASDRLPAPGRLIRRFYQLVNSGLDPSSAIRKVEDEDSG